MPKCLDLLIIMWGHTPRDRGTLISTGGHHRETTPNNDSHDSPHEISSDPFIVKSVGQSFKRTTRDYSINSPRSVSVFRPPTSKFVFARLARMVCSEDIRVNTG